MDVVWISLGVSSMGGGDAVNPERSFCQTENFLKIIVSYQWDFRHACLAFKLTQKYNHWLDYIWWVVGFK